MGMLQVQAHSRLYSVCIRTNVCHDICVPKRSCPEGACESYHVGLCTVGYILTATVNLFFFNYVIDMRSGTNSGIVKYCMYQKQSELILQIPDAFLPSSKLPIK